MVSRCLGEDAFLGSHVAGNYAQLRFSRCEGSLLPPHPQVRTPVSRKRFAHSYATSLTKKRNLFHPCQNRWFLATHCSPPYWSGGETRSLSILRPTTVCSMSLQSILPSVRPRCIRGMVGVSALCLPPSCKSHPGKTPLPRIRQRHAKQPDKPRRSAHLDRERNRRWAEHCGNALAERCQSLLHGSTMERERPRLPRKVRPRVHR
jgi:hypothetical protein